MEMSLKELDIRNIGILLQLLKFAVPFLCTMSSLIFIWSAITLFSQVLCILYDACVHIARFRCMGMDIIGMGKACPLL